MRRAATMQATITTPTQKDTRLDADARTTLAEALRLAQGVGIEHLKEQIATTLTELTEGNIPVVVLAPLTR